MSASPSRPLVPAGRSGALVAGGVLASLLLSTGGAVALASSTGSSAPPTPAAVAAPEPTARTVTDRVSRASRGAARTAIPPVRYVRRTVPVGKSFTGYASWYGPRFHGR